MSFLVGGQMTNTFDYYKNQSILVAIEQETSRIKGSFDKQECQQEIFAELYDFMPLDDEEAIKIVNKVGRKYRRDAKKNYAGTAEYRDYNDWFPISGGYQRKAHMSPAD
jgi:hypothetical protein